MRKDIDNETKLFREEVNLMNKSEMARRFGCSWKTIDRRVNPDKYKKDKITRIYSSMLDTHKAMIATKVDSYGCTAKAVYLLLKDRYEYTGSYSLVNKFVSSYKVNSKTKLLLDLKLYQDIKLKLIGKKI